MTKKLTRSTSDAKVCGICGGVGKYLDVDSTLTRIIAIVAIFAMGIFPGLVIYFVLAMIIPRVDDRPYHDYDDYDDYNNNNNNN